MKSLSLQKTRSKNATKARARSCDAEYVWNLLHRFVALVFSAISPGLAKLGLEAKELFVLMGLEAKPYPAQLAATISIPKPTMTFYLKRLQKAGFIEREIDTKDLRRNLLKLTPSGRQVMEKGRALVTAEFGLLLESLSPSQQEHFSTLLEKLVAVKISGPSSATLD